MRAPSLSNDDVARTRKLVYQVCEQLRVEPTREVRRVVLVALQAGQQIGYINGYGDGYADGREAQKESTLRLKK
jgi:hypothetical protein